MLLAYKKVGWFVVWKPSLQKYGCGPYYHVSKGGKQWEALGAHVCEDGIGAVISIDKVPAGGP